MLIWHEFKITFSKGERTDWQKQNYQFIGHHLMKLVDDLQISDFWVTNYFRPNIEDHIKFRAKINSTQIEDIETRLSKLKAEDIIQDYAPPTEWNPKDDVAGRVNEVRRYSESMTGEKLAQFYRITGIGEDDIAQTLEDLEKFYTEVLGKWTKEFYERIPQRPRSLWFLSLAFHLLLNSLIIGTTEENIIRDIKIVR